MTKKNSLRIVPYADVATWTGGERKIVTRMLEYTMGKPGEQTSLGWGVNGARIGWVANEPFCATLKIDRLERGRSAARFWFINTESGVEYPFFGQGLVEMLANSKMENGLVSGEWIAVRRGANYGIEKHQ